MIIFTNANHILRLRLLQAYKIWHSIV